jgi:flagellar motor switch/type III secretory pathway protein FliN
MSSFDLEILDTVVAACRTGQEEAALAFQQGLGLEQPVRLSVGDSSSVALEQLIEECPGGGLILILQGTASAAVLVLPESSGLVPNWCRSPDGGGEANLARLAVDLGSRWFPASCGVGTGTAGYVQDLPAALRRAGLPERVARIVLAVQSGTGSGTWWLLWPASDPAAALEGVPSVDAGATQPPAPAGPAPDSQDTTPPAPETPHRNRKVPNHDLEEGIQRLPAYSRSLLKIQVPVKVTLAEARQPLEKVLAIGPGSIIHFNKPCEDAMTLELNGQKIALGEAVKVGDKFGLWITSMVLPEERFWVISNRPGYLRAK